MKLKTLLLLFALFVAGSATALAQDEINRAEFFGGFSHNRVDSTLDDDDDLDELFDSSVGTNGVNLSVTGNFSKYVGLKFDYAHHRKTEGDSFSGGTFSTRYTMNSFMGGVQIKNNAKEGPRFKPFAHVLVGAAKQNIRFTSDFDDDDFDFDDFTDGQTNLSMAFGGGLDVRVSRRVDIRVFQIDYNPIFTGNQDFGDFEIEGRTQHNVRFGFGIVIH